MLPNTTPIVSLGRQLPNRCTRLTTATYKQTTSNNNLSLSSSLETLKQEVLYCPGSVQLRGKFKSKMPTLHAWYLIAATRTFWLNGQF